MTPSAPAIPLSPAPSPTTGEDLRPLLVAALLGSAAVHAAVVQVHLDHWLAAGACFALVAAASAGTAAALVRSLRGPLLLWAAAVSLLPLAVWVVSRTAGLPFGPEAGVAEAVGVADLAAGALELTAAGAAVLLLRGRPAGPAPLPPVVGRLALPVVGARRGGRADRVRQRRPRPRAPAGRGAARRRAQLGRRRQVRVRTQRPCGGQHGAGHQRIAAGAPSLVRPGAHGAGHHRQGRRQAPALGHLGGELPHERGRLAEIVIGRDGQREQPLPLAGDLQAPEDGDDVGAQIGTAARGDLPQRGAGVVDLGQDRAHGVGAHLQHDDQQLRHRCPATAAGGPRAPAASAPARGRRPPRGPGAAAQRRATSPARRWPRPAPSHCGR